MKYIVGLIIFYFFTLVVLFWSLIIEIYKPKIELRNSKIHGRGIFAKRYIYKGDIIEEIPLITDILENDIKNTTLKDYAIQIPSRFNNGNNGLCGLMLGLGSLYNHSDEPSAEWEFINEKKLLIRAIKNIYPDEEIFVNYGEHYWKIRNYKKMN